MYSKVGKSKCIEEQVKNIFLINCFKLMPIYGQNHLFLKFIWPVSFFFGPLQTPHRYPLLYLGIDRGVKCVAVDCCGAGNIRINQDENGRMMGEVMVTGSYINNSINYVI